VEPQAQPTATADGGYRFAAPTLLALLCLLLTLPATGQVNNDVLAASVLLGTPGDDAMVGAGVGPDGSIYLAANAAGGGGVVMRLNPGEDYEVANRRQFNGEVRDLCVDRRGHVFIAGSFGAVELSPSLRQVWSVGGDSQRIDATDNGSAAIVLSGRTVAVVRGGRVRGSQQVPGNYAEDVAIGSQQPLIFVTGYDNKRGQVTGQPTYPVQVAWIRAYDLQGQQVWRAWGWGGQEVADTTLMADSRGYRLDTAGGSLYFAGESAGGNSIFSRSPLDLAQEVNNATPDRYQHPFNTASNHITYVCRLDEATGEHRGGTFILARLNDSKGNTIRPRALEVDDAGHVYVGGESAFGAPLTQAVTGLEQRGAWLVAFSPDWQRRFADCFGDEVTSIGIGDGLLVAAGRAPADRHVPPHHSINTRHAGADDAFAVALHFRPATIRRGGRDPMAGFDDDPDAPGANATTGDSADGAAASSDDAQHRLDRALQMMVLGNDTRAQSLLRAVVRDFPDTRQADQARRMLGD
jgi:hypothetical protein